MRTRGIDLPQARWPQLALLPAVVITARRQRGLGLPPIFSNAFAVSVPVIVAVSLPRGRPRNVVLWGAQMCAYKVAFEIDDFDLAAREGWSVLIQVAAHHVDSESERASMMDAGVESWPGGEREHHLRIFPTRISGRRIRQAGKATIS